ncbi:MAG: nitrate reductase NapAB chaperone NapD [Planctomycetaceae bacterium]|jgi:nitrate reductase NapAB chaperone NapD
MIASVVATLEEDGGDVQHIVDEFCEEPSVEIGDVGHDARRVPITIDSPAPDALEETTRRLQECRGVAFVDVVFVHFEDESESNAAAHSGKMKHS